MSEKIIPQWLKDAAENLYPVRNFNDGQSVSDSNLSARNAYIKATMSGDAKKYVHEQDVKEMNGTGATAHTEHGHKIFQQRVVAGYEHFFTEKDWNICYLRIEYDYQIKKLKALGISVENCFFEQAINAAIFFAELYIKNKTNIDLVQHIPVWYSESTMRDWLIQNNYSKKIAIELAAEWTMHLQGAFKKGWEKGKNDGRNDGIPYEYCLTKPDLSALTTGVDMIASITGEDFISDLPGVRLSELSNRMNRILKICMELKDQHKMS